MLTPAYEIQMDSEIDRIILRVAGLLTALIKTMGIPAPGVLKTQPEKCLNEFRNFAEKQRI